ncbi:MAG: VOC family protein [Anaerolineae bacterium]
MFSRSVSATIAVVDLDRARSFYEDKLGLNLIRSDVQGLEFDAGEGTRLQVYKRPTPANCDQTVAAFEVDDVGRTVQDLSDRGIQFEHYDLDWLKTDAQGIASVSGEKAAWFKDPEGNILALYERVSEKPRETTFARSHTPA